MQRGRGSSPTHRHRVRRRPRQPDRRDPGRRDAQWPHREDRSPPHLAERLASEPGIGTARRRGRGLLPWPAGRCGTGGVGAITEGMIGMPEGGPAVTSDKPSSRRRSRRNRPTAARSTRARSRGLVGTAESAVLIRNLLLAQHDGNAAIVLAGPATGVVRLLDLYRSGPQIAAKCKQLVVAAGSFPAGAPDADDQGRRRRGAEAVRRVADADRGGRARKSATRCRTRARASRRTSRGRRSIRWSTPTAPFKPMPYDAPAPALAAVLYAVHPDDGYFKLSDPGTITVLDDGRTQFTPGAEGKHRYLIVDPAQKEKVLSVYTAMVSAPPAPRPGRGRAGADMKHHAWAIGVASTALILAVNIKSSEQGRARAPAAEVLSPRQRLRRSAPARPAAALASGRQAADPRGLRPPRRSRCSTTPAASATTRAIRPAVSTSTLYRSVETLHSRSRSLGTDPVEAQEPGDAAGRCLGAAVRGADQHAGQAAGDGVPARRRGDEAGSGPRHGAAVEPGRIHQHDPRSAGRRLPRRPEFPDRRLRRRLRQHRRRADRLAGADGEVPLRRGPHRRTRRSPPARCRSRSKSNTACASRTSAASIRATSRRRTASISTPTTTSRSACRASGRRMRRRSRSASGWTGSWPTPCRSRPSRPVSSTSTRFPRSASASPSPKAITRCASGSSTIRSSRRWRKRTSTRTRSTSGSARSPSSVRSPRRVRSRAASASWSAIRRPVRAASTAS